MTVTTQPKPWFQTNRGREALNFYLFILPWTIGFLVFILGPIIASFYFSFTRYDIVNAPRFVALENFIELFTDSLYWRSLYNTVYIVILAVPLGMIFAFAVALLLNQKVWGMAAYRTAYFIPSIVPAVASAALWLYLLQPQWGLINGVLGFVGLPEPGWLASENWSKPSIILLMVWRLGGTMIIYLAGLQDIPEVLYEAAEIDGANWWGKFRNVTLPLMTPSIFFTLVMGIIATFQVFDVIFVLTDGMGGPLNSTLVYMIYLFHNGFNFFRMGYASAMAWVLFLLILLLTWLQFRIASKWVYYESETSDA
ncbi:sugar ABC transporter permease [Chloroflexi bacterium TSY]|nr:sugar ABC transporter permease [Chloroflexi bacterium TSY]